MYDHFYSFVKVLELGAILAVMRRGSGGKADLDLTSDTV